MVHCKYLIIGGGMAAAAAVAGIREIDKSSPIGLLSAEPERPYSRPLLSKGLWKGESPETLWIDMPEDGVELHLGCEVVSLDPAAREVRDRAGYTCTWEKLLLATGATPRRLPFGEGSIIYYRTLADYRRLELQTREKRRFAVVGGGFIGPEIAAALAMNGKEVLMLFPGPAIGSGIFPADLAVDLNGYYREQGVELWPGEKLAALEESGRALKLRTESGRETMVDGVVAGIGVEPDVRLAREAGLEVGDGIIVDEFLRTSHPDIYAAGDVASFRDDALGVRRRVEHEDSAVATGHHAGRAMAGAPEPYRHLPFFYSDMFERGYEAVGELDSTLETVADWREPYREGVVYYLSGGRVRGVLLWNVWEQVDAARELIASVGPFRPEDLKGRI